MKSTILSPSLVEASNGVLLALLFFMILYNLLFLFRKDAKVGHVYRFSDSWHVSKAAIALFSFFVGFFIRTGIVWYVRHMENHGQPLNMDLYYDEAAQIVLILGTAVAVIGGCCWIRVVVPFRYPWMLWTTTIGASAAFGIFMAL